MHHILFADGTVELLVGFPRTEEIIKIIINGEIPPKGIDKRFIEAFSPSIRASPNLPINRGRNISNCIPHANPLGLQHLILSIDDQDNYSKFTNPVFTPDIRWKFLDSDL